MARDSKLRAASCERRLLMHLRNTIIVGVCILLAVGLLIAAGLQLDPINQQRQEMKLVINKPENIPPSLLFATVATGAFRGLLVDFLWIRADRLKEEGQFYDARQLAQLITILQPRFASVWVFQAWNMAYNISVAIPQSQAAQRWLWVKNGYELLRDQAIGKYHLKDIGLYQELGQIFQHKIGGVSDEDHRYYKLQLATQIDPLLSSTDVGLTDQDNKYFDLLAQAPATWREIISDSNVAEFVNALKGADSEFNDESKFVGNYLSLRQNASQFNEGAGAVIDKYRGSDVLKKFDIFAKAYQLRKVWKLEPDMMRKINHLYGPVSVTRNSGLVPRNSSGESRNTSHEPMDWRLADTQAIYWAEKGLEVATVDSHSKPRADSNKPHEIGPDETNTDRIVFHSLQNLFRQGKLIIFDTEVQVPSDDPSAEPRIEKAKQVFLRPDLRYFQPYNDYMLKMLGKYDKAKDPGTYKTLEDGHRNMLKNAVFLFYQSGHRPQAQEIYDYMKGLYPLPEFNVSLKEYTTNRFLSELKDLGITDAIEQITAILKESYYYWSIRDDDMAAGRVSDAKDIYDYYQKKYEGVERTSLPPFEDMKFTSMQDFRSDEQYPEYIRKDMFLNRLYIDNRDAFNLLMEADRKKQQKTE
jgi:hypothetical protein